MVRGDGGVLEIGTHGELPRRDGAYAAPHGGHVA
ncbi:hypothetical protein SZN_27486 [Streptomyces zinciresistens K42]|uniref:Uncharacterized protein n=1 Tax=Streptomyces zinciresistens K42 TaxID=700597 RepID=G2GJ07_9ACTN|nr:hypothetical protein SZN_27486 [Streptomyces zinciresistens K42]